MAEINVPFVSQETLYDTISFDSSLDTTFYVDFTEFVPVYNGLKKVWIGDGTTYSPDQGTGGTAGYLYAKYYDGMDQGLGFVSDYEEARTYIPDLTYAQWVEILSKTPQNALDSEAYAKGTKPVENQGVIEHVPVTQGETGYLDNAKYYKEQAGVWAVGNGSGTGEADNNAKHWAEQSKSYTNGKDLNNQTVQARATDNAEYFKDQAKLWANYGTDGQTPTATNNAKAYAQNATNSAMSAQQWATGNTGASYSAGNSAKEQADRAAVWAVGNSTGNGSPTNNAKYWSEQAAGSASNANASAQSCTNQINAKLTEIQTATTNANTATTNANTVASRLENITASANTLESNQPATASVTLINNHYDVSFGIPRGTKGDKGDPNYLATSYIDDANESGVIFDWAANLESLSARTILFDPATSSTTTIYDMIKPISNNEIDALFV